MSKKRSGDAYGKLVRVLIVLFVLTVICFAGYMLLDQSIRIQEAENAAQALKDAADGIIGSTDEDGVAKWLLAHVPQEA